MSDKILYYNDVKQTPAGDGTAAPPSDTDNKKVDTTKKKVRKMFGDMKNFIIL